MSSRSTKETKAKSTQRGFLTQSFSHSFHCSSLFLSPPPLLPKNDLLRVTTAPFAAELIAHALQGRSSDLLRAKAPSRP